MTSPTSPERAGEPARAQAPSRLDRRTKGWLIFFTVVIGAAGACFVWKLYEFFYDLSSQEGFRFAGAHLSTYLLVAAGYFLLLAFAFLRGHFADIEQPKYDILEEERRRDEAEFRTS